LRIAEMVCESTKEPGRSTARGSEVFSAKTVAKKGGTRERKGREGAWVSAQILNIHSHGRESGKDSGGPRGGGRKHKKIREKSQVALESSIKKSR